jgi:hypothetical protein
VAAQQAQQVVGILWEPSGNQGQYRKLKDIGVGGVTAPGVAPQQFVGAPAAPAPVAFQGAPAPVAAAATNEAAAAAAAALVKPKPKRINYRKNEYFYQIKKDGTGKPLGYLLFNTTDSELSKPVGYVEANPATGLPKGPVIEPPKE